MTRSKHMTMARGIALGTLLLLGACTGEEKQAPVTQAPANVAAPAQTPAEGDVLRSRPLTIVAPGMEFKKMSERTFRQGWVEIFDHRNGDITIISFADPYGFLESYLNADGARQILKKYNVLKAWKPYEPVVETRTKEGPLYLWAEKERNCVVFGQFLLNASGVIADGGRPSLGMANVLLFGNYCGPSMQEAKNGASGMLNGVSMN